MCDGNKYKVSMTDYEQKNIPKDLSTGETSAVKKDIIDQQVKLYVTKEAEIKDNICKMYEIFGGNVLMPCKATIIHDKGYEEK